MAMSTSLELLRKNTSQFGAALIYWAGVYIHVLIPSTDVSHGVRVPQYTFISGYHYDKTQLIGYRLLLQIDQLQNKY